MYTLCAYANTYRQTNLQKFVDADRVADNDANRVADTVADRVAETVADRVADKVAEVCSYRQSCRHADKTTALAESARVNSETEILKRDNTGVYRCSQCI